MIIKSDYPILEFDSNKTAKLNPSNHIDRIDVPECCVITFFREVIEKKEKQGKLRQIASIYSETICIPVYETDYEDKSIGIITGFVGAAGSAGQLEELIAMGFKKFIVCGGAGVLRKDIQAGHIVIPTSAVRDEGVSYHYIKPSREIECSQKALNIIENQMISDNIPYIKAKTWTTDAYYRETQDKIALRVEEGCVTVEMEASAFFAVSQFRNVELGQILYGGDDLSGEEWDSRQWKNREEIRSNIVELALKICTKF